MAELKFLEAVRRARSFVEENRRVSLRALQRELGLGDEAVEALAEELVEVQQVALREGKLLVWSGAPALDPPLPAPAKVAEASPPEVPSDCVAATAERRPMTVLFCDLANSTETAAQLDAEDWREMIIAYYACAGGVVARFGGHVAQHLGDGVLVYFGYPTAHEDAAERAVRTGLGLLEAIQELNHKFAQADRPAVAVRVGIHSGLVVVGDVGEDDNRLALAVGDTTNLAARLQASAPPNAVVLSEATLRLAPRSFVTRDLGVLAVKGFSHPIRAYEALDLAHRNGPSDGALEPELTDFVGREQDLGVLCDRFSQLREGRGHAVLIRGEAGIGKSRLVRAARSRLPAGEYLWLECQGSAYTANSAFRPVLELFRASFGLREDDAAEVRLDALEAGLEAVGFELPKTLPPLALTWGVPLCGRYPEQAHSPEEMRQKTLGLLTEWTLRLSRMQPLVLLIEDLHWIDPSTLELVGQILEQIATVPVLLIATHRPEFDPPWRPRSHVTPLWLGRFTQTETQDLIRNAARGTELPEAWMKQLLDRSDGVPLFAEELTRTVLTSRPAEDADGSADSALRVPETLQDSLMARLDRVKPAKQVAQLASVLGREFSYSMLSRMSSMTEPELQQAIDAAVREEIFFRRGSLPDATFVFKHALIQDVAYQSLLRATRQSHHLRLAETLIELTPAAVSGQPELVAHHLSEGGDGERALEYWEVAGNRAMGQSALAEAARHFAHALRELGKLHGSAENRERELQLLLRLGVAQMATFGYASDEATQSFARARKLCRALGGGPERFPVLFGLYMSYMAAARETETLELTLELETIAGETADSGIALESQLAIGVTASWRGEHEKAIAALTRAKLLYDPDEHRFHALFYGQQPLAFSHVFAGWSSWLMGRPDRAVEHLEEALSVSTRLGHPFTIAGALVFLSMIRHNRGENEVFQDLAERVAQLSFQQNFAMWKGYTAALQGRAWVQQGRAAEGLERIEQGLAGARATGARINYAYFQCLGLEALLNLKEPPGDFVAIDETLASFDERLDLSYAAEAHRLKGELLRLNGAASSSVEPLFQRALEIARGQEARSLELRAAMSLARLWQPEMRNASAAALLEPIYESFGEGFDTKDLTEARALLNAIS